MPWKASSAMQERARFVLERERGESTMSELCAFYGVSRETGYEWWRRYQQAGLAEWCERSRAPRRHPNQTAAEIEAAVLELRRAHMRWGARKLKRVLEREHPATQWPAASTMGTMLAREGLVMARRKRRRVEPYTRPFAAATEPNRVWCTDFKGWFRTQDGERIDPLTMSDAHSRYLLRCQAVEKTDTARVQAITSGSRPRFPISRTFCMAFSLLIENVRLIARVVGRGLRQPNSGTDPRHLALGFMAGPSCWPRQIGCRSQEENQEGWI